MHTPCPRGHFETGPSNLQSELLQQILGFGVGFWGGRVSQINGLFFMTWLTCIFKLISPVYHRTALGFLLWLAGGCSSMKFAPLPGAPLKRSGLLESSWAKAGCSFAAHSCAPYSRPICPSAFHPKSHPLRCKPIPPTLKTPTESKSCPLKMAIKNASVLFSWQLSICVIA